MKTKKEILEHIVNALPYALKDFAGYVKDNFDAHGQDIVSDSTGIASNAIKLLGKPYIDEYFDKLTAKKLENYGLDIYLKASLIQATESLEVIKEQLNDRFNPDSIQESLESAAINFNTDNLLLVFRPKDHPAVNLVRSSYEQLLKNCDLSSQTIKQFIKDFNEHIAGKIQETFGSDYEAHIDDIKDLILKDNETDFLLDMVKLGRIGFKENEQLNYEQTYVAWKKAGAFKAGDNEEAEPETELKTIEDLINQYFDPQESDNTLDKILFVLADFGKGKSVFLRRYAAQLAKDYLETNHGLFPVYFNLRDFSTYSSDSKLGVIADYLETKYSLKIDNDYFKNKQYLFLIDSLDESGELNKANIEKVINSIKKIQQLDKEHCRNNRIIITSRPFDEGLETQLHSHKPYVSKNSEGRDIPHFISIYGFQKEQFNHWLTDTLHHYLQQNTIETTGFAQDVITAINNQQPIDIYDHLLSNETLSATELRRPIFAYMIFQLIINNIDFSAIGKIGVYLSFLNLLTKEAKHINDTSYQIDLRQEFEFRNLLHVIATLWMYERQQGKQGALKKADICRVLDGENKREMDAQTLERYKSSGVTEIQFLSHSYFGENDNVLHFQHQSFAEILLAEYYLKVFIKYALDEESNVEEARTKLILGEPTAQTIQFLQEMLNLLKDTVCENNGDATVIEKRKLLFPLMAALGTQKNNKLFCNSIYYEWFKQYPINAYEANYPVKALENWCINQAQLDKIIELAKEVIESNTNYLLTKAETKTVLYDNELLAIQNNKLSDFAPDMDRWLALLVGNTLYNDIDKEKFFNGKIKNFEHLFDLIRNWNYAYHTSAPIWSRKLFMGINMRENNHTILLSNNNFNYIDFSYSYLRNINAISSDFRNTRFYGNNFFDIDMVCCLLAYSSIENIIEIKNFRTGISVIHSNILMPIQLANKIGNVTYVNFGSNKTFIGNGTFSFIDDRNFNEFFNILNGLLIYGLKKGKFTVEEIKSWFDFETEELKDKFYAEFDKLKGYEGLNADITDDDTVDAQDE